MPPPPFRVGRRLLPLLACVLLTMGTGRAAAEPVPADQADTQAPVGPPLLSAPTAATTPNDEVIAADALEAPAQALVDAHAEADRRTLLQQSYQARPPTWIQGAATINLGDHPTHDDPTAQAEQQLRTLEWVLEQQRRDAAVAARMAPVSDGAGGDPRWRQQLRGEWLPWLKEHRDEVIAASVVVLLGSWLWSVLPQRRRHRHRRRRHRTRAASDMAAVAPPATSPSPAPAPVSPLRRRRRRRSHTPSALLR